jgi:hypothetical protein
MLGDVANGITLVDPGKAPRSRFNFLGWHRAAAAFGSYPRIDAIGFVIHIDHSLCRDVKVNVITGVFINFLLACRQVCGVACTTKRPFVVVSRAFPPRGPTSP